MKRFRTVIVLIFVAMFAAAVPASSLVRARNGPAEFAQNVKRLNEVSLEGTRSTITAIVHADRHLFMEQYEGFLIYDVSNPADPKLVKEVPRPGGEGWPTDEETLPYVDPVGTNILTTNGKILAWATGDVRGSHSNADRVDVIYVMDVRDKENPRYIGRLDPEPGEDMRLSGMFCILDCKWIYGRRGGIIDLRDPRHPRLSKHSWMDGDGIEPVSGMARTIKEVGPHHVLTATIPMYLLNVSDPERPRVIAKSEPRPRSHGDVAWPGFPTGRLVLSSDQIGQVTPRCEIADARERSLGETELESKFGSWTAVDWRSTHLFGALDSYRPQNGTYVDGDPPITGGGGAGYTGCGVHRFDAHPAFRDAGLVSAAAYSHGVKILRVDRGGDIEVAGWYLPVNGHFFDTYWITDRIVYGIGGTTSTSAPLTSIYVLRYEGDL